MKIKNLHIRNFKSLIDLEITNPNPFTVFVGANGVGKSNIFEALEFSTAYLSLPGQFYRIFGSKDDLLPKGQSESAIEVKIVFDDQMAFKAIQNFSNVPVFEKKWEIDEGTINEEQNYSGKFWISAFSRLFIGNRKELKLLFKDDLNLVLDGSNLEKVLKRLLQDESKREEIVEYLQLLIPEFENVEIHSDELGGIDTLLIYEKYSTKPFNKNIVSDGTYNILCLLTAVFQSEEPQFLCIEEPENGLNPFVVKELVNFFRTACREKGHYIWLNTHSQSLVEMLTPEEIILVEKVNGETKVKQIDGLNLHGLPIDEAWISGALGGGMPW